MTTLEDVGLVLAFLYLLKSTISTLTSHTLFSGLFTLAAAGYVSRWLYRRLYDDREAESNLEMLTMKVAHLEDACSLKQKETEMEKEKTSKLEAENKQIPVLKRELEDARKENKERQYTIETLEKKIADLKAENRRKDEEVQAEKEKTNKEEEGSIEELKKKIADLEGECQIKDKQISVEKEKRGQLEVENKQIPALKEELENARRKNEMYRSSGAESRRFIVLEREIEKTKQELAKEREKIRELVHIGNQHAEKNIREIKVTQAEKMRVAMEKCESFKDQMKQLTEEKEDMKIYYTNLIEAQKSRYERLLADRGSAGQILDEFGNRESFEISMQGNSEGDLSQNDTTDVGEGDEDSSQEVTGICEVDCEDGESDSE